MIHAKKMMLVPYVQTIQNPEELKIVELDNKMTHILQNKNLKLDEKLTLYNIVLAKFLALYKISLSHPSIISNLHNNNEDKNNAKEAEVASPEDYYKYKIKKEEEEKMEADEDPDNNFSMNGTQLEHLKLPTKVSPFNYSLKEPKSIQNKTLKRRSRVPAPYSKYHYQEDPNTSFDELHIQQKELRPFPPYPPNLLSNKDVNFQNFKNKIKTRDGRATLKSAANRVTNNIAFKEKHRPRALKRVAGLSWENLNSMYRSEPSNNKKRSGLSKTPRSAAQIIKQSKI
jgi:hypothetical protein